jgi:hypothetical protein
LLVGESDCGEEVRGLIGSGVAWNIKGVETDREGKILKLESKADSGGGNSAGQDGGGARSDPACRANGSVRGAEMGVEGGATWSGLLFLGGEGDCFETRVRFE